MKEMNKSTLLTREKIIRATVELIEENGYLGTTTQAICERAKVAPGRINYHFGSKDDLIVYIAEMIPTKIKREVKLRLPDEYKNDKFLESLFFDALLIKVIYTDNEYMEIYRSIYSQNFICSHIIDIIQDAFTDGIDVSISETMIIFFSNAAAYAITSLAKKDVYQKLKHDVNSVIHELVSFHLFVYPLAEEKQEAFINSIIEFVNSVEFEIIGITDINFI